LHGHGNSLIVEAILKAYTFRLLIDASLRNFFARCIEARKRCEHDFRGGCRGRARMRNNHHHAKARDERANTPATWQTRKTIHRACEHGRFAACSIVHATQRITARFARGAIELTRTRSSEKRLVSHFKRA